MIKEIEYYPNGQKKYVVFFKNRKRDGKWIFYDNNGEKVNEVIFKNGKEVNPKN